LTRITADPADETMPTLSPDGRKLLFAAGVPSRRGSEGEWESSVIVGVNPSSGAGRTLYTSTRAISLAPSWLPDGSFVFTSDQMGKVSVVRALSSSPNSALAVVVRGDLTEEIANPDASPAGDRVAFEMRPRGAHMIGVSDLDGSNFTVLTEGRFPAFSPDRKRIAFARELSGRYQIFTVDARTGGNLVQVTNGEADHVWPKWAPDGSWIVYASDAGKRGRPRRGGHPEDDMMNLFLIRPDGTQMTQLTNGPFHSTQPEWGSDGWIYFSYRDASQQSDIWRLHIAPEIWKPGPARTALQRGLVK
jgi:Tol biopolymer transport system component